MAWIYLDDQFPDHPKVVTAGGDAGWLFVCGLAYCRRQGTSGAIPKGLVSRLSDRRAPTKLAKLLVEVGLWEDHGDHFQVHDYDDWNRSHESRSEAGRKAARARWDKQRNADASDDANASERNANVSEPHMPQDALSLSHPLGTYGLTTDSRVGDPPAEDPQPPNDRGSLLWAHRLAARVGGHARITDDQAVTELLTAWRDNPDRSDTELVADLEARTPA